MTVSDNPIQVEGLESFFEILGRISAGKKLATNVLKNPCRALVCTGTVATAAASSNPKLVLSTLPEVVSY